MSTTAVAQTTVKTAAVSADATGFFATAAGGTQTSGLFAAMLNGAAGQDTAAASKLAAAASGPIKLQPTTSTLGAALAADAAASAAAGSDATGDDSNDDDAGADGQNLSPDVLAALAAALMGQPQQPVPQTPAGSAELGIAAATAAAGTTQPGANAGSGVAPLLPGESLQPAPGLAGQVAAGADAATNPAGAATPATATADTAAGFAQLLGQLGADKPATPQNAASSQQTAAPANTDAASQNTPALPTQLASSGTAPVPPTTPPVKAGAVPEPSSADAASLADASPLADLSLEEATQATPVHPVANAAAVTRQASAKASAAAANAQQQAQQELSDAANGSETAQAPAASDAGPRYPVRQDAAAPAAQPPGAAPQAGGNMVLQQMLAQANAAAKAAPAGATGQTGSAAVAATQARSATGAANLALMAQAALQAGHAAPQTTPAAADQAATDTAGLMAIDGSEETDLSAGEEAGSSDQDFQSDSGDAGSSSPLGASVGDVRSSGDGSFARAVQQASAAPGSSRQMLSPAAQQLAIHVQRAVANNNSVLSVQLNPREMGMIDIHVQMQDGNLRARVTVEKQSTLDQFQKDAAGLQKALADAGLSIDSNSLQFDLSGQNQGQAAADARDQQQFRNSSGRRSASTVGGVDNAATVTQTTLYVEEGRVDLKV